MTTYHVWLTGHNQPEVIEADDVFEADGRLAFVSFAQSIPLEGMGQWSMRAVRTLEASEWQRWSVVHDEADHVHI